MASFGSLIRKVRTSDDYIKLVESVKEDIFDLPFMDIVKHNNHFEVLPMINSLKEINRIHRNGLDVD